MLNSFANRPAKVEQKTRKQRKAKSLLEKKHCSTNPDKANQPIKPPLPLPPTPLKQMPGTLKYAKMTECERASLKS